MQMQGAAAFKEKPTSLAEIHAEIEEITASLARRSNLTFTTYTNPDYEVNWHHEVVAKALDRVVEGKCRRLMVFEPPQNGKSEQVSRRFPAYVFGKKPNTRIIACSYTMSLAEDMSRDVQKIMDSKAYRRVFPNSRLAEGHDTEKRTQKQFDVVGRKGYYIAAGVDGPITGKSADIGIIDDPIKNRAEADSEVYREKVWNWYKTAFTTRQFGNKGAIIICLTRWHEDDLAGRLLKLAAQDPEAEQWEVISLEAIAQNPDRRIDHREIGEALWPAKYPLDELKRRRVALGEFDWSALYQQDPKPAGGALFKEEWFADRFVDAVPAIMRQARGWDTAGTEDGGDWTVGVKIGEEFVNKPNANGDSELCSTGRFFVVDVVRKQLGPYGVDKLIQVTAENDANESALDVAQREEKEGGSAGLTVIEMRKRTLARFNYDGVTVTGSKRVRSKPFRTQCEAGNVYIKRAPWNTEYIKELCAFPNGTHDDQVDGSSAAYNSVLLEPIPEPDFATW